ncbi:LamB/YcsF family protein [Berryella wangjianweii]|uniref:5-oxoprolinase subunit A n=1 Tax=Berryella wangjianweii TaxID=2734634 RepID=A0A6M8J5C6_9ACTN|nr:5-oxoprolinase subunit PxpA [Berryella wangjianweii]QKF07823.1 LamB/YcsF family protein [Berryella wangjianweii]
MHTVDLNCDIGESFGAYAMGLDARVIPLASSVNVACGMHAGDPLVMERTVALAAEASVAVGAHPGYPDLQGFGRRDMALSPREVRAFTLYQIGALAAFCQAQGVALRHVKPHGQLYNRAARDRACADAIADAVRSFDSKLVLVGLAGGQLIEAGRAAGLRTASEFFADRNYTQHGTLVPRTQPNAVLTDETAAAKRVVQAVREGWVESVEGARVPVAADTICTHGDNEHALAFVRLLRQELSAAGVEVRPL